MHARDSTRIWSTTASSSCLTCSGAPSATARSILPRIPTSRWSVAIVGVMPPRGPDAGPVRPAARGGRPLERSSRHPAPLGPRRRSHPPRAGGKALLVAAGGAVRCREKQVVARHAEDAVWGPPSPAAGGLASVAGGGSGSRTADLRPVLHAQHLATSPARLEPGSARGQHSAVSASGSVFTRRRQLGGPLRRC
jgi:hypothetical protein